MAATVAVLRAQTLALHTVPDDSSATGIECRVQICLDGSPLADLMGADGPAWTLLSEERTLKFLYAEPRAGHYVTLPDESEALEFRVLWRPAGSEESGRAIGTATEAVAMLLGGWNDLPIIAGNSIVGGESKKATGPSGRPRAVGALIVKGGAARKPLSGPPVQANSATAAAASSDASVPRGNGARAAASTLGPPPENAPPSPPREAPMGSPKAGGTRSTVVAPPMPTDGAAAASTTAAAAAADHHAMSVAPGDAPENRGDAMARLQQRVATVEEQARARSDECMRAEAQLQSEREKTAGLLAEIEAAKATAGGARGMPAPPELPLRTKHWQRARARVALDSHQNWSRARA